MNTKKIKIAIGLLSLLALVAFNINSNSVNIDQNMKNSVIDYVTTEAYAQTDPGTSGKWYTVSCGPGQVDVCAGDGDYICCKP